MKLTLIAVIVGFAAGCQPMAVAEQRTTLLIENRDTASHVITFRGADEFEEPLRWELAPSAETYIVLAVAGEASGLVSVFDEGCKLRRSVQLAGGQTLLVIVDDSEVEARQVSSIPDGRISVGSEIGPCDLVRDRGSPLPSLSTRQS